MYRLICIMMTNLMQDLNGMHFELNCTRFPIYKCAPLCSISQSADKFNITYKSKCLKQDHIRYRKNGMDSSFIPISTWIFIWKYYR